MSFESFVEVSRVKEFYEDRERTANDAPQLFLQAFRPVKRSGPDACGAVEIITANALESAVAVVEVVANSRSNISFSNNSSRSSSSISISLSIVLDVAEVKHLLLTR